MMEEVEEDCQPRSPASQQSQNGVTPTPTNSPVSQQSQNALTPPPSNSRSGWRTTPNDCVCECKKVAYVIFHGRRTGIFRTWSVRSSFLRGALMLTINRSLTQPHVNRFPDARFRGYHSVADAELAYQDALLRNLIGPVLPQWSNHHYTTPCRTPCVTVQLSPPPYSGTQANGQRTTPSPSRISVSSTLTSGSPHTSPFLTGASPHTPPFSSGAPRVSALAGGALRPSALAQDPRSPLSTQATRGSSAPPNCSGATERTRSSANSSMRTLFFDRDEHSWWVVSVGNRPGVYFGRYGLFQLIIMM